MNSNQINYDLVFVVVISFVVLFLIVFGYVNAKKSFDED
jgi:hypothetical protein